MVARRVDRSGLEVKTDITDDAGQFLHRSNAAELSASHWLSTDSSTSVTVSRIDYQIIAQRFPPYTYSMSHFQNNLTKPITVILI